MTKANVVQSSAMRNAIIVGAEAGFFTRFSTPPSPSHCPRKFLARAGLFLPIGLGVAAISDDWKRGERERERERERGGVDRSGDWRVTQCREMSWHSPRSAATFEFESLKKSFAFSVSRSPFRATPGRPPARLAENKRALS